MDTNTQISPTAASNSRGQRVRYAAATDIVTAAETLTGKLNPVVGGVNVIAYDNEQQRLEAQNDGADEYDDGQLYDILSKNGMLVSGKDGRWFLIASLLLQCTLLVLLFVGHHHRTAKFDCCNLWVVCSVTLFLLLQLLYYIDWESIYGHDPSWHRANIVAPLLILIIVFLEWGGGMLSMIAHAMNLQLFTYDWENLSGRERVGFIIATVLYVCIIAMQLAQAWAYRNNLGQFYYEDNETGVEEVVATDRSIPVQGSFDFRQIVHIFAHIFRYDTSACAIQNLPRLLVLTTIQQTLFYVFVSWSHSESNQSNAPVSFIILGFIAVIQQARHAWSASVMTSTIIAGTRKWSRHNLFFPIVPIYVATITYFTYSSIFPAFDQ